MQSEQPYLVVRAEDSRTRCHGFEPWRHILDGKLLQCNLKENGRK